ncbi:MAG TPA: CDP-alcohol phosphatidyltransferase family protein [Thermoanaerobaculaceae bacterium]|nr:CDP-alcohol phosphatidyltransferase family protein [Thermoanaerobaculaceae bacterium]
MTGPDPLGGTNPGMQPGDLSQARRRSPVAQRAAKEVRDALRPFTIPNGITLVRLALVPFFILAVLEGKFPLALGLFLAAGLSDGLDGWLARSLGMRSLLGSYLDPIADKALLVAAFVALTWPQPGLVCIPLWLTVLALSRDFLIVLTALVLYLGADVRTFPPSIWAKSPTVIHIVTIALVLVANIWPVRELILLVCFYLALGLTLLSGVDYIRRASLLMEKHGESTPHQGS